MTSVHIWLLLTRVRTERQNFSWVITPAKCNKYKIQLTGERNVSWIQWRYWSKSNKSKRIKEKRNKATALHHILTRSVVLAAVFHGLKNLYNKSFRHPTYSTHIIIGQKSITVKSKAASSWGFLSLPCRMCMKCPWKWFQGNGQRQRNHSLLLTGIPSCQRKIENKKHDRHTYSTVNIHDENHHTWLHL